MVLAYIMIKVSKLLKVKGWNHCAAHALHLLLTSDSMKRIPEVMAVLHKCKLIVNALHFKADILEREVSNTNDRVVMNEMMDKIALLMQLKDAEDGVLLSADEQGGDDDVDDVTLALECENSDPGTSSQTTQDAENHLKRGRRLQNEVSTRWNSTLEMAESLLRLRSEVTSALKLVGKYDLCLKVDEWGLMKELANFLQTFRELTELVSTKVTSLSLIPLMRAEISDACKQNSKDSDEIKSLKQFVVKNLDKRFPVTRSVTLATLLDPAMKKLLESPDSENEDMLYTSAMATEQVPQATASAVASANQSGEDEGPDAVNVGASGGNSSSAPVTKKMKLIQKHSASMQLSASQTLRDEIKKYLHLNNNVDDEDPLVFWKANQHNFPLLSVLAKTVLTQSASSVAIENMFSTTGLLNGKRSTLAPNRANWLTFIHDNFALYFDV